MRKQRIKNILVSQPQPADITKSPFYDLSVKYGVNFEHKKFLKIEKLSSKEFRQQKINILDYTAVFFTSRHAVDHFFNIVEELRVKIPKYKYFCMSEVIAFYLQKYIPYRKRRIFYFKNDVDELIKMIKQQPENQKILLPCSDETIENISNLLKQHNIDFDKCVFFKTEKENLSELKINTFDMIVFFSSAGVKSFCENFPKFVQGDIIIAGFGETTENAIKSHKLRQDIIAPTHEFLSMSMALDNYLSTSSKK